jgi:hypothetical protein
MLYLLLILSDVVRSTKGNDDETHLERMLHYMGNMYDHLPVVLVVSLAFLVVSVLCAFCIMCQFEYRRKKYLAWKSIPSSGYSTPTKGYTTIREGVDTSVEDLVAPPRPVSRRHKIIKRRLKMASILIQKHLGRGQPRIYHSLPTSPFLSRPSGLDLPNSALFRRRITGDQVKRALKAKSRRYRRGRFRPLNRPHTPLASPLLAYKRHSRSLSDIASLLSLNLIATTTMADQTVIAVAKQKNEAEKSDFYSGSEVSVRFENRGRRRLMDKNTKERLIERRNRRLTNASSRHSMASTVTASASNGSLATLKPTASLSEFSEHSGMSGDQELEFDLYDCDLNNVSNLPGSMFAPALYYDLTPTAEEELELTELFPKLRQGSPITRGVDRKQMVNSLTSDLAASMTSEDLTIREEGHRDRGFNGLDSSCYYSDDINDEDCYQETDNLLLKHQKPSAILNLTHIDDISFVDD